MATVYLAHEERYDRPVAIKVLRPELAAALGAERFLREIRITATLQHPHILPLYDSGDAGGLVYYVMPFIEGESLRARLDRQRQLPLREALEIARSVASALDYAHRRGLIHRDVKPENILLTGGASDGADGLQALVADFGVAVAVQSVGAGRLTDSGISVGTPSYMSPEQASAERTLGAESDVYALGVVLYEMLTGEPPFTGPTAQAVVAKVMIEAAPALRSRRATVPPHVEAAVMKALEKTPADRFASAAQFADALESSEHAVVSATPGRVAWARSARWWLPWSLIAGLTVALIAQMARGVISPSGTVTTTPTHVAVAMPEGVTTPVWSAGIAAGAHGRMVAFVAARPDGRTQMYLKRLDEPNVAAISGTDSARYPVFSPDGASLAFFAEGRLKKLTLATGSVTLMADSAEGGGESEWLPDGSIAFFRSVPGVGRGTWKVPANGGAGSWLTRLDTASGESIHFAPHLLPGGTALIYSVYGQAATGAYFRVMGRADSTSRPRVLIEGASFAQYIGDDKLAYQKGTSIYVANIDRSALRVSGERRLMSGVVAPSLPIVGGAAWALSDDILVYGAASTPSRSLVWVDRDGRTQTVAARPQLYVAPTISPDGRRAAIAVIEGVRSDLWIYDFAQDVMRRATTDGGTLAAVWSPDGQRVATATQVGKSPTVFLVRADSGGAPQLLLNTGRFLFPASWTKDGTRLVLMDNFDVSMIDLRDGATIHPLVHTPAREFGGRLSPDERWLAYLSNVTGTFEVWVTRFPEGGPAWRVSHGGAREAVWSRDGRELFFRSENGRQMRSVSIKPGATFAADSARLLWEGDYFAVGGPGFVNYDVSLDGKRFLMLQRAGSDAEGLSLVQGWRGMMQTVRP